MKLLSSSWNRCSTEPDSHTDIKRAVTSYCQHDSRRVRDRTVAIATRPVWLAVADGRGEDRLDAALECIYQERKHGERVLHLCSSGTTVPPPSCCCGNLTVECPCCHGDIERSQFWRTFRPDRDRFSENDSAPQRWSLHGPARLWGWGVFI